ncbi:hypothetical protein HDU99_005550 [Rhizoclosmatium hyalinum]|nr:hypothetical protein HDU99_005550 [Rhizoclosmatium hyalinum]
MTVSLSRRIVKPSQSIKEKSRRLLSLLEPETDIDKDNNMSSNRFKSLSRTGATITTTATENHTRQSSTGLSTADANDDVVVVSVNLLTDSKPVCLEPDSYSSDATVMESHQEKSYTSFFSKKSLCAVYTCPVCWESRSSQELVVIGDCGHSFCYHCLQEWSSKSSECPYCRHEFDTKVCILRIKKAKLSFLASKVVRRVTSVFLNVGARVGSKSLSSPAASVVRKDPFLEDEKRALAALQQRSVSQDGFMGWIRARRTHD